ncbi:O-antigen ligase family protein [Thermaurantimonas aggregans]|nr:O-antigen ligase family protein [Thermaurantimonas aggregans]
MNAPASVYSIQTWKLARKQKRWEKLLFWYSFMMAFPSLLLFNQNASLLIFLAMVWFIVQNSRISLIGFTNPLQRLAALFGIGAILSVANIPSDASSDAFNRALSVLPNYLYWSLLIIILIQQRRLLRLEVIYKAVFWGVVCTVIYYLFLQQSLRAIPIFNRQTPNNFSFILISYTPIAIHYLKEQKNRIWALAFLMLLVFILLKEGRRAGMVLVFLGGMSVLYADYINWKRLLVAAIAVPVFIAALYSPPVEAFILQSSDRIHEMIYETEKVRTEDRSYLVRVAMVKKALAIFEKHPLTGIGLNNFTNYSIAFDESFEGAKYVVTRKNIQQKSAHNSYIGVLAEGGLLLFLPFVLILLIPIYHLIRNFNSIPVVQKPVFYGHVMMAVHLYFIMSIVNVFTWFLIALASALVYRK